MYQENLKKNENKKKQNKKTPKRNTFYFFLWLGLNRYICLYERRRVYISIKILVESKYLPPIIWSRF